MSKAVRKIGRSIKKVVKGVGKVAQKAWKSPIGKALMIAGTVYFGGAAIGGMMGGAGGAGAGMLSNAAAGISNAWTSLGTATSAAMGGNFSAAGQALSAGAKGATLDPGSLLSNAGIRAANGGITSGATAGKTGEAAMRQAAKPLASNAGEATGLLTPKAPAAANALDPKMLKLADEYEAMKKMGYSNGAIEAVLSGQQKTGLLSNPLVQYGGMQLAGSALTGYAAEKATEEQDDEDRKRYNANMNYTYQRRYQG